MEKMTPAAVVALARGEDGIFMAASLPGGIEAQEKAGQLAFVAQETLPINMRPEDFQGLAKYGVVFGNPVDKLFQEARFPPGWTKRPTEHSMWSDLVDDRGRKRASIFYKAAFYDRNAHLRLEPRFAVGCYAPVDVDGEPTEYGQHSHFSVTVHDAGVVVHTVGSYPKDGAYEARDHLIKLAEEWLTLQYPDWRDLTAYWE